jgi:hypothetical protein
MGKKNSGRWMVYLLLGLLLLWPLQQLLSWAQSDDDGHEPIQLLYQVSLFQMELLNSYLNEASKSKETGELDLLKQSLYSSGYTHERLVLAVGKENLTELKSISQLMQIVLRLEIGGDRPLKAAEVQILQDAALQFKGIHASYEKLMSSRGSIISSQNEKIRKQDEELNHLIRKKLLE